MIAGWDFPAGWVFLAGLEFPAFRNPRKHLPHSDLGQFTYLILGEIGLKSNLGVGKFIGSEKFVLILAKPSTFWIISCLVLACFHYFAALCQHYPPGFELPELQTPLS